MDTQIVVRPDTATDNIGERLIDLQDDELIRFKKHLIAEINRAEAAKDISNKRIQAMRELYYQKRPVAMRRSPDGSLVEDTDVNAYTVPVFRAKIKGFKAAAKKELNKYPLAAARPKTERDREAVPAMNMLFDNNLTDTGGYQTYMDSLHEAAISPAPLMVMAVKQRENGDVYVDRTLIPYEDWCCYPVRVKDFSYCNVFISYEEPAHLIRYKGEQGEYDREQAEALYARTVKSTGVDKPNHLPDKATADMQQEQIAESEVNPKLIRECYYRYGGKRYRVFISVEDEIILRLKEYDYKDALGNRLNCHPIRVERVPGRVYGVDIGSAIDSFQEIVDFNFNADDRYRDLQINPWTFVDQNSELWSYLQSGKKFDPSTPMGVDGDPRNSVYVIQFPDSQSGVRQIGFLKQLIDMATFSDLVGSGNPLTNVRSATEVGQITSQGNAMLGDMITTIASDWAECFQIEYDLLFHYLISQRKIVELGAEGEMQLLIAEYDITAEQIRQYFVEFIVSMGAPPELGMMLAPQLTKGMIGGKRPTVKWTVNGVELIADKMQRAQKVMQLMNFLSIFQAATQYSVAYKLLEMLLDSLEIDKEGLLPDTPPTDMQMPPEQMQQILQFLNMSRQGGAMGGMRGDGGV